MSRLPSRIVLVCICGLALACRHAPPSIPDQARLYAARDHRLVSTTNPETRSDAKPANSCCRAIGA